MSTSSLLAATFRTSLVLLDTAVPEVELNHHYRHDVDSSLSLTVGSWSWDRKVVSGSLKGGKNPPKLVMTSVQDSGCTSHLVDLTGIIIDSPVTSLKYSSGPKLKVLALGTKNKVLLFDLVGHKIRRELKVNSNFKLNTLDFNAGKDSHLAVGGSKGTIQIFNATSGVATAPVVAQQLGGVAQLRFNPLRTSMLGGCADSGIVALWDSHANKLVNEMAGHKSPATGVVFSPINDTLLASSGLDKRCNFYDLKSKDVLTSIKLADPVTSLDIRPDGVTVPLGTSKGGISIYDLRSCTTPIHKYQGPTQPVSWMSYKHPSPNIDVTDKVMPLRVSPKTECKENISIKSPAMTSLSKNDSITGFFSPLRGGAGDNSEAESPAPMTPAGVLHRLSVDSSIISPLREHSLNVSFHRTPLGASSGFSSPLAIIREESQKSEVSKEMPKAEEEPEKVDSHIEEAKEEVDVKTLLTAFPNLLDVTEEVKDVKEGDGDVISEKKRQYLRSLQCEALDDFYTDIKRHLWHIDWELVKNFQNIQEQIEEIRNHDVVRTTQILLEEISCLRKEIEELKSAKTFK